MYYFKFNAGDIIQYVSPTWTKNELPIGIIIGFNRSYADIAEVEWLSGIKGRGSVNVNDCKKLTG